MSYEETKKGPLVTIRLTCDARDGAGICGSRAEVSTRSREACGQFLYAFGWRLLRGHQVCSSCLHKKRVTFPRKAKP
jgi:hypothetical protein